MQYIKFLGELFSKPQVYVEAVEFDDFIRLEKIRVNEKNRNQGFGTGILKEIIAYADKKNKTLVLYAEPQVKKWSIIRLKDFYKRFGFIENEGKNYIHIFKYDNMYRLPQIKEI